MTVTEQLTAALAGRYRVERQVGRGGMATVYLARDLRHERPVALKVLHPELGALLGPERFLSEIRVTASLQHPNLLPLFDSGEAEGRLFYTMPFVDGESLRQRLDREQQLPVAEAVRLAVAVAAALDHAHRRGVVHRDLKPENILLADGQPLVADFGIALAVSNAGGPRVTQTGLSLGTPQYMSPEQAAGERQLDGRADVYALGCVLYEMLAGEPPFTGPSAQAVLAKLMTEPARPVARLRRTVPAHVDATLARALEKLPADRFATAHEFAEALQRPDHAVGGGERSTGGSAASGGGRAVGGRGARRRDPLVLALATVTILALLVAGAAAWSARRAPVAAARTTPVRFALALPLAEQRVDVPGVPVVFSPDGRAVLYGARSEGAEHAIHYRPLDQLHARPLPGTEGARAPFFSPDGASVGFVMPDGRLMTMRVDGGTLTTLARVSPNTEGAWAPDDVIVLSSDRGLLRMPAGGGPPELLTRVDSSRGERYHVGPRPLADGRTVLFTVTGSGLPTDRLGIVSLETGRSAVLDIVATNALALVEGHLLVGRADGSIAAVPFDLDRWTATGPAVPLLDGVLVRPSFGAAASAANDGSLVYVRGSSLSRLELVDEAGQSRPRALGEPGRYRHPRLSPDGRRIAVEVERAMPTSEAWADVWVHDLSSGVLSRLTSQNAFASRPEWTPDGRRIAFISQPTDSVSGGDVWWVPADRSGPEEPLRITPKLAVQEVTFSPDGRYAVLRENSDAPTGRDLWLLPLAGAAGGDTATLRARPLFRTPFTELGPRVSPDGRWLAYVADETGRHEVYVRPFPGPGGRVQVSAGGGMEPAWGADGRLIYRSGTRFLSVAVRPAADAATASVDGRRTLFEGTYLSDPWRAEYDVQRATGELVLLRPESEDQEVVVVLDWMGELRARTTPSRGW